MTPEASPDTPVFTIGVVARMLGVSVHTIRMYERSGLLIPFKASSGQRLYSSRDVERLHCMRNAITKEKISIQGIRRILSLSPCWKIVHCTEDDRAKCPSFNGHSAPCWTMRNNIDYCGVRECRSCVVYREFGDCRSIKEVLLQLLPPE